MYESYPSFILGTLRLEFGLLFASTSSSIDGYILIGILALFWAGAIAWGRSTNTVSLVEFDGDNVTIRLSGPTRLLSLRKQVVIPASVIVGVASTPNVFGKGGTFSRKIGNLTIPTFFRVGSFRGARGQGTSFWACFRGETAVTLQLSGYRYQYIVVDVQDPEATVALIQGRNH